MSTHHEPRSAPRSTEGPSLNAVHEDPSILARVPVRVIVRLRCQVSHLAAELDAALFTALAQPGPDAAPQSPDRLLTPAAAAERFGVTRRWLLAHADQIPGVKRLSRKIVRFSERRLARFLDKTAV